jgi:hypothetical protein
MTLVPLVVWVADKAPEDEDVVAGWTAFAIFALLIVAVVFLAFSLVKQLRKVDQAEAAGLYDPSDKKRPSRPGKGQAAEDAGEE